MGHGTERQVAWMSGDADEPRRDQRHIQSIEVGFRLISVLEMARAKLPLKTIAERAGMPASKAHLYMVSFMRLGIVVQDPTSMRYGLGPYVVQLGLAGLRQLDVLDLARGPMEALQQRSGLSVYLSVWANMGPTIIARYDGELDVPMMIKVGHVLPLLTSATGRVFLALLPPGMLGPALRRASGSAAVAKTVVADAKREVGRNGVALSDSRVHQGFAAMSAPILDHDGAITASMTLIGLRAHVPLHADDAMVEDLRATCRHVSRALGYEMPDDRTSPEDDAQPAAQIRPPRTRATRS